MEISPTMVATVPISVPGVASSTIGVPCDMVFFQGAKLPHGYMDKLDTEPHAKEAFGRMMAFIQKYI